MSFITLDFETFYSDKVGFKRQTNEEYLRDPQFEVVGVSVKVNDAPAIWFSGDKAATKKFLDQFDWKNSALLAHNTMFDGAILAWHFDIVPAKYFDTLCMARAIHGVDAGGSLAKLAEQYKLGEKGTEVVNAIGKRRIDFDANSLDAYGEYCKNDTELTYKLFTILATHFPRSEFDLIDMTLRMYTQPVLCVNDALLVDRLNDIREEKSKLLSGLQHKLSCNTEEEVAKKLGSNPQFAQLLKELGVTPPMKISPTTGKETYALAKTDEGFIALQEHEDPFIQQLCSVRLGTKSTIEESRIERFIEIGSRNRSRLPVPLKYYGAHTGRWSGMDMVNFQNLPSRDKRKKTLKNAIIAPDDHYIINCDSSQIEARVLAWLAGQNDVTDAFAKKRDVYCEFATKAFGRKITKADEMERFVGKTCLAEGTLVLCDSGWKPIEEVSINDKVWDGEEWVCHQGSVLNGFKETLNLSGILLTPDHLVLCGTKWLEAQLVAQDKNILSQALATGAANLPSQDMFKVSGKINEAVSKLSSLNATAVIQNTQSIDTTSKPLNLLDVTSVLKSPQLKPVNCIGDMPMYYQTTSIDNAYSIDLVQRSQDAIQRHRNTTYIMDNGVLPYLMDGEKIERNFSSMYKHYRTGIFQNLKWIELMLIKGMNRIISDSYRVVTTLKTNEESLYSKKKLPVYDILSAGMRNRFTVMGAEGQPIIVHNCVLGLGYGTGAKKLQQTLSLGGAELDEAECKRIVDLYRREGDKITALWGECDRALVHLASWPDEGKVYSIGNGKAVWVTPSGIRLPNGLYIKYPELRMLNGKYVYNSRRGIVSIWGGAMVENIVQALARIIVGEQMLAINKKYRVILTVHDAAVIAVPKEEIKEALNFITDTMSTAPSWCADLPVACEAKYSETYGGC